MRYILWTTMYTLHCAVESMGYIKIVIIDTQDTKSHIGLVRNALSFDEKVVESIPSLAPLDFVFKNVCIYL